MEIFLQKNLFTSSIMVHFIIIYVIKLNFFRNINNSIPSLKRMIIISFSLSLFRYLAKLLSFFSIVFSSNGNPPPPPDGSLIRRQMMSVELLPQMTLNMCPTSCVGLVGFCQSRLDDRRAVVAIRREMILSSHVANLFNRIMRMMNPLQHPPVRRRRHA